MTADQFWYGDSWLAESYRIAHDLKTERKNQEAWLHGFYIFDAITVGLSNALSKKGSQPHKYMEKPVRITPITKAEKEEIERIEREKAIEHMKQWANRVNLKLKGGSSS